MDRLHTPSPVLHFARASGGRLFAVLLAALLVACDQPPTEDPYACGDCNLLLISIDTLRADHLGCYGYERPTSPAIDRFAAQSTLFEQASSVSFQTTESHMSLFTSLYPTVHGVRNSPDRFAVRLSDAIPTLAEELQRAGLTTVAFHGGGNVSPGYGFARGFGRYEGAENEEPMVAWLESEGSKIGRWFAFYHTYHVHDPYLPEPPNDTRYTSDEQLSIIGSQSELDRRLAEHYPDGWEKVDARDMYWSAVNKTDPRHRQRLLDLYDGEINEADVMVGRILDTVGAAPGRTLVVILSDHGEAFGERDRILHNKYLYEELLHVPLIIRHPDQDQGRRISDRVSLIDVGPTILEMLGVPGLPAAQGRSLLPLLRGEASRRAVYAEKVMREDEAGWHVDASLSDRGFKILRHSERLELYNLDQDPGEERNLIEIDEARAAAMSRSLEAIGRLNASLRAELLGGATAATEELDDETVKELQALGYL